MHARIAQRARSLDQAAALVNRVSATESLLPSKFASRLVVQEALGIAERHLWSDASLRAPEPHLASCGPVSSRSYCTDGQPKTMAAAFTCGVCEARAIKSFTKSSFERGVVIVKCPKCANLHLIADRLGWFGEPGSVDHFLAEQGQGSQRATVHGDGTIEADESALEAWAEQRSAG